MQKFPTSGEDPVSVQHDGWETLLEVSGRTVVDHIVVINEGDFAGFWRLTDADGESTPARLPCGGGASGERRASMTISCPGFSGGTLEVKRGALGGYLTGLFAHAGRNG